MDDNKQKFSSFAELFALVRQRYSDVFSQSLRNFDDLLRGAANGFTIGQADKFAGLMEAVTKGGTVKQRIDEENAKTAHAGIAETGGDLVGSGLLGVAGGWALEIGADLAKINQIRRLTQVAETLKIDVAPKIDQLAHEALNISGRSAALKGVTSLGLAITSVLYSENVVAAAQGRESGADTSQLVSPAPARADDGPKNQQQR
jgi:hypothetical protein